MKKLIKVVSFIYLFVLIISINKTNAQTIVTIGTGTYVSSYMPLARYYNYSAWDGLYESSEINASGEITKLAFYKGGGSSSSISNVYIYMKHTTATVLSSGTHNTTGYTLVYSGSFPNSYTNEWKEVTLTTPFAYNGSDNLMIYVRKEYQHYTSAPNYRYTTTSTTKSRQAHSDSYMPSSLSATTQRPNIQLTIDPNINNDAGIISVTEPISPTNPGLKNVKAVLKNFGQLNLTSCIIKYSLDGVTQAPYTFTGSIAQNGSNGPITIGTANFSLGSHEIKAWTESPNSVLDSNMYNDTSTINVVACITLNGTYTIGGTGSSFSSISSAISSLTTCGIAGPVTFNIAPGIYNEQIYLPSISGTSFINTVTFQSSTGNPNDVIINYNAIGTTDNHVVKLDGADFIKFKNLTLKSLNPAYGRVVELAQSADLNEFSGNKLIGVTTTSTSDYLSVIYSYNSTDNYNTILNNEILNGSYGIYFRGYGSTSLEQGNTINNNTITGFSYYGIYVVYNNSIAINSNTLESYSLNNLQGIYLEYCDNSQSIKKNKISLGGTNYLYGIYIRYCDGTSTNQGSIANNFISLNQGTYNHYGIYSYNSNYQNYYYNSVNINGGSTSSRALYHYNGGNVNIANNILSNTGGGYALYVYNPSYVALCNYNDLYATGSYLAYWQGNRATLNDLKTYSGKDLNSKSVNPNFFSSTDLHINNALLNGMGTVIAGISDDIDGDTRSYTAPDIGADEFDVLANDAGIYSYVDPLGPCPGSANNVIVKLKNYGTSNLISATINWKVNGVSKTAYSWTGSLAPLAETNVTIGTHVFLSGTSYNLKIWSSLPNSVADLNNNNDTVNANNLLTAMNTGTYTIGPSASADYPSFTAAVNTITLQGVCGPIVFSVESGNYNEQFILNEVLGMDTSNTVTFQSASGVNSSVVLNYSATSATDNYVIHIDGGDNFKFKNMTIQALDISYSTAINLSNNANHNELSGNIIMGISTSSTSTNQCVINSIGSNNYNSFLNNVIKNGSYGIYLYGNNSNMVMGNTLQGNSISDFSRYGAYLYYNDSVIVRSNTINITSNFTTNYGLYCYYSSNGVRIEKNRINSTSNMTTYGMYFGYCNGTGMEPGIIANNFISQSVGVSTYYGIYLYNSNYYNIYYNSANITAGNTNSTALYQYSGSNHNMLNNNFVNTGGGYAVYVSSGNSFYNSDYNNYYVTGNYIAYWQGYRTTLAVLKSYSSKDYHSYSVNPGYATLTNLHLNTAALNGKGYPVMAILDDIDGDTRGFPASDIGADEFNLVANDAGISALVSPVAACPGVNNVVVKLNNYGTANLTSVTINWSINDTMKTVYNWTGSIASQGSTSITLGSHAFYSGIYYSIKAWTSSPNSVVDVNTYNDTMLATGIQTAFPSGTYIIGSSGSADYSTFTSAINAINTQGICGPVIFNVEAGTYTEQIILNEVFGASAANTITFQSASGNKNDVILMYNTTTSSTNYVVQFDGGDYFKFKNMTIKNTNATYGRVIDLINTAEHNIIEGNTLIAISTTSSSSSVIYDGNGQMNNFNTYLNNYMQGGYHSIYMYGGGTTLWEKGTVIQGNELVGFYIYPMYVYYQDSIQIIGNNIHGGVAVYAYGIYGNYLMNGYRIVGNTIKINATSTSTCYGIRDYRSNYNSYNSSPSGYGLIANNFISILGGSASHYGIYSYYVNGTEYYYNSINLENGTGTSSRCLYQYNTSSNTLGQTFKNNIFVNKNGGYAAYFNTPASVSASDYNVFYASGNYLAYWSGNRTSLSALQSASSKDANSLSLDPLFASSTDLHLYNITINGAGTPLTVVLEDIDGDTRNTSTPDIGADEFNMFANDVAPISVDFPKNPMGIGNKDFKVSIKNFGTSTLTSATINWKVDSVLKTPFTWTGSITSLDKDSLINIGSHNMTLGNHTITIWTSLPNGVADQGINNDTLVFPCNVILKPEIDVNPYAISATITTCNDSIYVPLKIYNIGTSDLIVNLDSAISSGGQQNSTIEILALTYEIYSDFYNKTKIIIVSEVPNANITELNTTSSSVLSAALQGKDILYIPYLYSSSTISVYQTFTPAIQAFVNGGGTVIFGPQENYDDVIWNTGSFSGNQISHTSGTYSMQVLDPTHPIMQDVVLPLMTVKHTIYFSITNTDADILATYNNNVVVASRNIGSGKAVLIGFTNYFNSTNSKSILRNAILWGAESSGFISYTGLINDTISPGDSTIVNVELRAVGLANGDYIENIEINSNDIATPTLVVPCTLHVAGAPIISTSSNSISFPATINGLTSTDTLTVTNNGCDDLVITSMSINSASYSVTGLVGFDSISPGSSKDYLVNFNPTSVGANLGVLTIFNNDTNKTINLSGIGLGAPDISVNPSSLNVTIPYCSDSVNIPLTIKNIGQSVLNISIGTSGGDTVEVLALTYQAYSSYYNSWKNIILSEVPTAIYTELNTTSSSVLSAALQGKDIVFIPYINSSSAVSVYNGFTTVLQAFVNGGGTVLFGPQLYYENIIWNTGLLSGHYTNNIGGSNNMQILDPTHPLMKDIIPPLTTMANTVTFQITNTDADKIAASNNNDIIVTREIGKGKAILIGYTYTSYSTNTRSILKNAILWGARSNTFISYNGPTNDTITSGDSTIVNIKFNAKDLSTGTYTSSIKIESNDIQTPSLNVPCTLNVLNQLQNAVDLGNDTVVCGPYTLNAGTYSSYLWNNSSTSSSLTVTSSGAYSVTVTSGQCTDVDTITVIVNPAPSVNFTGLPTTMCFNNATVNLIGTPVGGVFSGTGITGNSFNPAVAGLGTHSITYIFTNSYNCTNTKTKNVTVNSAPNVVFTTIPSTYCSNEPSVNLSGIPIGGTFSGAGVSGSTFNPSVAGAGTHTLFYNYSNIYGCSNQDSQIVLVKTAPIVTIFGLASQYCENNLPDTFTLSPVGGTLTSTGTLGNVFFPSVAGVGTHTITYSYLSANGCADSIIQSVIVNAISNISFSGLWSSYCEDATNVVLIGNPSGGTFTGNGITGNTFNPTTAGVGIQPIKYSFTNSNACTSSQIQTTTIYSLPQVTFSGLATSSCINSPVSTLIGSPLGGTFTGVGVTANTFDPAIAGLGSHNITYTYADNHACINSDIQTVVVNNPPNVDFTGLNSSYCNYDQYSILIGSPSGGVFSGIGVIGNKFYPSVSGAGSHNITYSYTDLNNCVGTIVKQTTVNSAPIVNAGQDTTILTSVSVSLSGSASAGSGNYSYSWSPTSLLVNANVQNPITTLLTSTTLFTLVVTDNITNCVDSDQVFVIFGVGPLSAICTASPNIICNGKASYLNAIGSGGSGIYTYSWTSSPAGFSSTLQNPIVYPTSTTTYTCTINDGSLNASSSIIVTTNPLPSVSISGLNSSYCTGSSVVNITGIPTGGTFSGQGINGNTFNPGMVNPGNYNIVYTFVNASGCANSDTANITVNISPIADAGSDTTVSCGLIPYIQVGSSSVTGYSYSWTPLDSISNPNIANPMVYPNMTTVYTVSVTDIANGCVSTDDVIISVIGGPTANAGVDTTVCIGDSAVLSVTGGINYIWSTGDTTASITVAPLINTNFIVTVTDTSSNCASSDTVMVLVDNPNIDFGPDTSICNTKILLDAGVGYTSYLWSTGAITQMIFADTTGIGYGTGSFSVTVTSTNGCPGTGDIDITFVDCTGMIEIQQDIKVELYPNPTKGILQIDISGLNNNTIDMCIVNMAGQIMYCEIISNVSFGKLNKSLDLSYYPKGIYFIRLLNNETNIVKKIVIQ